MRAAAVSIPLLLVGLLAFGVTAKSPSTVIDDSLTRGQSVAAPSFQLAVLQVPVVLNFWASWCVPCAEEAPVLEQTRRAHARSRGVLFLGLDMHDVRSDGPRARRSAPRRAAVAERAAWGRSFMHLFGIDYLNIRDPSNPVALSYGATGLPETFFISRSGKIVGHVIGDSSASQLDQGIAAALSGQVAGARRGGAQRPTR